MRELRYTLLSDGSSDKALLPILTWLLREQQIQFQWPIHPEWADLRRLPRPPKKLADKLKQSLDLFPCDLIFVHRDAEKESHAVRVTEILQAIVEVNETVAVSPAICVVPVRMQEAWLLFNETALRQAAGNPHGRQPLLLPSLNHLEDLPDPKTTLYELLREASGLQGRRRRQFPVHIHAYRVAEFIDTFAPLRTLPAFKALETEVQQVVTKLELSHRLNARNILKNLMKRKA